MGDWSKLPRDLVFLIAQKLTLRHDDIISFFCVCSDWHQAIAADEFFIKEHLLTEFYIKEELSTKPSLMLVSNQTNQTDQRVFYFPSKDLIRKHAGLSSFGDKYCLSSRGCLIMHSEDRTISLVNPATGATINLPHMNTISNSKREFQGIPLFNVKKVALSSNPFENPEQDCNLLIIYGGIGKLAFCKLGDSSWTFVDVKERGSIFDVIWYNERFYAINSVRTVFSIYISGESVIEITKMNCLKNQPTSEYPDEWYLVEFKKMLLAVARYNTETVWHNGKEVTEDTEDTEVSAGCHGFQVFAVEVDTGKVLEIKDIGEGAIFLGYNYSEYVKASKSIRPNSIYFNDHVIYFNDHVTIGWGYAGGTVLDTSVFSFQDGKIQPYLKKKLYHYDTPPIWIIPRD